MTMLRKIIRQHFCPVNTWDETYGSANGLSVGL